MTAKKSAKSKARKADIVSDKEWKFIREYLKFYNGTQAALKAGYGKNCNSAGVYAYELLRKPKIKAIIDKERKRLEEEFQTSIGEMVQRSLAIIRFDPRAVFDESGAMKSIHEIDDVTAGAIAGIESKDLFAGSGDSAMKVGELKTIKLSDRNQAINNVMKHLGGFEKDNSQKAQGLIEAAKLQVKASEKMTRITEKSALFKSMLSELNAAE